MIERSQQAKALGEKLKCWKLKADRYETGQPRNGALLTASAVGGTLLAMTWQPLTLLTNFSGRVDFTDVDATSFNERFHRIQAVLQRAAAEVRRQDPL